MYVVYMYECMYVCMCVRMLYTCAYVCVYICMYVKLYRHLSFPWICQLRGKGGGALLPGQQLASHTFCPGYVVPLERLPFTGQATQPPPQMPLTQPGTNPSSPKMEGCRRRRCMYVYMYVCMYVRSTYVCMYVRTYMPTYVVYMNVCMYICM